MNCIDFDYAYSSFCTLKKTWRTYFACRIIDRTAVFNRNHENWIYVKYEDQLRCKIILQFRSMYFHRVYVYGCPALQARDVTFR